MAAGRNHRNAAGIEFGRTEAEGFIHAAGIHYPHRHLGQGVVALQALAALKQHPVAVAAAPQDLAAMLLVGGEVLGWTASSCLGSIAPAIEIGPAKHMQPGSRAALSDPVPLAGQAIKPLERGDRSYEGQIRGRKGLLQGPGAAMGWRHCHQVGDHNRLIGQAAVAEEIKLGTTDQDPAAERLESFVAALVMAAEVMEPGHQGNGGML